MNRRRSAHARGVTLIACLLAAALSVAPAAGQCVGDCSGDGMLVINELITGVNIALGNAALSSCEPFDCQHNGTVAINCLIQGVGNALNGCPATPTATATVVASDTATPTLSPTPTPTTPPDTIGAHVCTFVPGNTASHIELNKSGFNVPVSVPLNGSATIVCGATDAGGDASCSCQVNTIDPVTIPGLGTVCITATAEPCAARPVACAGGAPLGVAITADGNIGTCDGSPACATACATFCADKGIAPQSSGCTGYCTGGAMATCTRDADCQPDNGVCNGPDPVGARNGKCQCQCVNTASGPAARPGELQCLLGATLIVVAADAADCSAPPLISVGPSCVPITTGTSSGIIDNANFTTMSLPADGPVTNTGAPIECSALRADTLADLKLRGVIAIFGSTPSDIVAELFANCR